MVIMRSPMKDADQAAEKLEKSGSGEGRPAAGGKPSEPMPAAGPHADRDLTTPEKTPGAGSLPDPDHPQEGDATTG